MKTPMDTVLRVRIQKDLLEQLEAIAEADGMTISQVARRAFRSETVKVLTGASGRGKKRIGGGRR